jgi:reprolysin-like metallo-peptidase family M12B
VPNTRRQRRRLPAARELLLALVPVIVLAGLLWQVVPVPASSAPRAWDKGIVRYYDASGMRETVVTAASRWNSSGARVHLKEVQSPQQADVIVDVDDHRLYGLCGNDCLGYTTSIGEPDERPTTVLLAGELRGNPRPLSVWVAAHELGHVLGLEHHDGRACSLMSPHAFDTRCAPSLAAEPPTSEQLACVPAPADVEAAARLYGGQPAVIDPRCR